LNNEQQIIQQLSRGDQLIFEGVYKTHYKELVLFALRFVEEQEDAEEIVQNLFYDLWTKRENINITSSLRAYLFSSTRNLCLNFIKHKKVEFKYKEHNAYLLKEDSASENDTITEQELADKIDAAVEKLPSERQKVFKMSRYDGLKYKDIAEKLNISIKTVENQMGKALKFLRDELIEFLPFILIFFGDFFSS
jgi:RNA polymerase sigma-70 factor (ECF subfamily)